MKKIIFLLLIILGLTITLYVSNIEKSNIKTELKELKEENNNYKEELQHYKDQIDRVTIQYGRLFYTNIYDISLEEFYNKVDNEDFIVVMTMEGCSHCDRYLPILDEVLFYYDIKAYHLELANLKRKEFDKLLEDTGIQSTPSTLIYKDGEVKDKLLGEKNNIEVTKFLKENGYGKK